MILIYVVIILIAYSLYWIYQGLNGRTGPQVHEDNKRLIEENEQLRTELEKVKKKNL